MTEGSKREILLLSWLKAGKRKETTNYWLEELSIVKEGTRGTGTGGGALEGDHFSCAQRPERGHGEGRCLELADLCSKFS